MIQVHIMCCLFYFFELPRQVGETFPLSLCLHENEMENKVDVALSGKKVSLFVKLRLLAKQITALLSLYLLFKGVAQS